MVGTQGAAAMGKFWFCIRLFVVVAYAIFLVAAIAEKSTVGIIVSIVGLWVMIVMDLEDDPYDKRRFFYHD
jgi:hypothetical protein